MAVPVTNDQPGVAARVVWVGAGETIPHKHVTSQALRAAVVRIQIEPVLPRGC
ncbi:MAG: hypothetical protein AB7F94_19420 [Nitrospira sp.]